MTTFTKDPDATLDYRVDWSDWLEGDDVIVASEFFVPLPLTLDADFNDTTSATCWLSGGVRGKTYQVVNRITTADGRTDDRTLTIWCRER